MIWQVVLHDDDVNTYPAVIHALRSACGMSVEAATTAAEAAVGRGRAVVARVEDRDGAEACAAALHVLGLHVTIDGG